MEENDAGAVITSVATSDADGDTVTVSVDDERFEVSDGNLKLKEGESLDYEAATSVEVMITASDGDDSTTATVTVSVTDVATVVQFTDATGASGISFPRGYLPTGVDSDFAQDADVREFGGGVAAGDYNDDGWVDLFIVRGDIGPNLLYRNNGDSTFKDVAADAGLAYTKSATENYRNSGPGFADMDGDGDLDWFVSSIWTDPGEDGEQQFTVGNRLYRNDDGVLSDATEEAGVRDGSWGWGSCFADFDNDQDLDIYHTNGWVPVEKFAPYRFDTDTSRLFLSDGEGVFTELSQEAGIVDSERGHGIVCGDFDNDGDVDIFQMHRNEQNAGTLWRNDSSENNYLRVKLNGRPPNTAAAGARITLTVNGEDQLREIIIGSNFTSQTPWCRCSA